MQFRERRRVIQVIRTVYDPKIKRGRSEVVGLIEREAPSLDQTLRAACSIEECREIEDYIAALKDARSRQAAEQAARSLPGQMRLVEAWLRGLDSDKALVAVKPADTAAIAAEIWTAWDDLSKALHKIGVGKSKHKL